MVGVAFYPFAYALLDDELANFCWYCLKEASDCHHLQRCSVCKTALFCDQQCQRLGWMDHKAECRGLARARPLVPDVEVRLLGRIVARHRQMLNGQQDEHYFLKRSSRRSLMEIANHEIEMRQDPEAMKMFHAIYEPLVAFYGPKRLLSAEVVFKIHSRNFINRHAISDLEHLREIGKGLYLDLCAYDHSCRPNAIYRNDGFVAILRPLENDMDLTDTKKTFYAYIDLLSTKAQRRQMLMDSWYFYCRCSRCQDEEDDILTSVKCTNCCSPVKIYEGDKLISDRLVCKECRAICEISSSDALERMNKINRAIEAFDYQKPSGVLASIDKLVADEGSALAKENLSLTRLCQARIRCLHGDDSQALLALCLGALPCVLRCYPTNHPSVAYHFMQIGILQRRCGDLSNARRSIMTAAEKFAFSLGRSHSMLQKCQTLLEESNGSI